MHDVNCARVIEPRSRDPGWQSAASPRESVESFRWGSYLRSEGWENGQHFTLFHGG